MKKQEAKQELRDFKQAELTAPKEATAGIDAAIHFLGYTVLTVALPHLGGKGPKLVPLVGMRPLTLANVNTLVTQAGPDMLGLSRLDPTHALSIAIDPSLLDPACLSNDQTIAFSPAVFQTHAHDKEAKLLAGQHRIAAVQKILQAQLERYAEIQGKREGEQENDQKLWEEEKTFHTLLTKSGTWLAKVYNLCE